MDIEKLAKEAGFTLLINSGCEVRFSSSNFKHLIKFARLVAEEEREECAKICDKHNPHPDQWSEEREFTERRITLLCAADIRARKI